MHDPWVLGLGAALGAAMSIVAHLGARAALMRRQTTVRSRIGARWWLRLLLPAAALAAPAITRFLPTAWIDRTRRRLRGADFDDAVSAEEWLALAPLAAIAGAALTLLLRGGTVATALVALAGAAWPGLWLHDRRRSLTHQIDRELPRLLELLTLAVEAGCSLGAALRIAVESSGASVLRRALAEALREIHAGRSRSQALVTVAARYDHPGLAALIAAITHAEASGAGIASTLRAQTLQRTEERFARAERLAMESPVKLLVPLILCIFPCAFLVIGFPIAHRLLQWSQE